MPHILFINEFFHPDICASATVATEQLPRIAALRPGWKITVLAGNRAWDDPDTIYPAGEEYLGLQIIRVERPALRRTSLLRRLLGFAAFQRGAIRAARRLEKIDLVIATTAPPQGGAIARTIARKHGCPYIYKVLDLYPDLAATLGRIRRGGFVCRRWLARDTRVMRHAACVVSIAERMTERIARTRDLPRDRLRTIHDGFDPARIEVAGPNEFKARYNSEDRFVVQYAGNMGLSHPFETILAAARMLADEQGVLFQFIGDGPQRPFVEANLPPNAQLIGYQPAARLGKVLATADICLISQHEDMFDKALPYKIYATLAAGKPCIFVGSRRSEIVEWLDKAGAGLHVDQGRPEDLAAAIRQLKREPDRRRAMGQAARRFSDLRFRADRVAAEWVDVIDSVLGR